MMPFNILPHLLLMFKSVLHGNTSNRHVIYLTFPYWLIVDFNFFLF